jgi:hypothetical protein
VSPSYAVGERLTGLVEPTGAELVPHRSLLPQGDAAWPDDPATAMRVFLDEAIAVLPRLIDRYDADPPDLLLYDVGGLPARVLGARYGIPAVQLSPTLVAYGVHHVAAGPRHRAGYTGLAKPSRARPHH